MTNTIKEGRHRRWMRGWMLSRGQQSEPSPVGKMEPKCERAKLKKAQEKLNEKNAELDERQEKLDQKRKKAIKKSK